MATKDRITCHVLDTTEGKPARGMRVRLELTPTPALPSSSSTPAAATSTAAITHHHAAPAPREFESQTDEDGRIKAWLPYSSATSSGEVPVYTLEDVLGALDADMPSRWTLRFDTAGYFGEDKTFFPEVTVVFRVEPGATYHVPLLLSPYSYTTYRGS
ncbi:transthyretin domain protein [Lasiosphaeria miniovina]|uniref:Transthyretin domain protein n=1 Tax=Lasiosphaeria miniovina TaxID=1954250 RepID=A0AA40B480_9PEZI|nr:transthyretin domain protein [Lasiosphaeria miniovina]KAK0727187.1 transthyretin domain protein [Lasiosphaeria miniovina]